MKPDIKFTSSGDVSIAYQIVGSGPMDLVVIPGWASNLEVYWECPEYVRFHEALGQFCRVILFDKRGTGLSDRVSDMPSLEIRMDDVNAVMQATGSERASLFGWSEGGCMAALFAASYPDRVEKLALCGAYPRRLNSPDFGHGIDRETLDQHIRIAKEKWGGAIGMDTRAPSMTNDLRFRSWWEKLVRQSVSRSSGIALWEMSADIDIRPILSSVTAPTLILHATNDLIVPVGGAHYMAAQMPNADVVEYTGDHVPFLEGSETILTSLQEHLTGNTRPVVNDRVLATVMFTDIVSATEKAGALGDQRWSDLLDQHHALVRRELDLHRGTEIDTAGDGFFASFDGPARAVQCGQSIVNRVRELGLSIRAGVHTGECERTDHKLSGIAVHVGARVAGKAAADEVLVTRTVRDLVAGSGLEFAEMGSHPLKGIDGQWELFAAR